MCLYFATLWSMLQTWSTQPIRSTQACKYIFHIWPSSFLKTRCGIYASSVKYKRNFVQQPIPEQLSWDLIHYSLLSKKTLWSDQNKLILWEKIHEISAFLCLILDSGSCEQDKSRLKVRSFWSKMHNRYIRHKPVKSLYKMKLNCNIRFKTMYCKILQGSLHKWRLSTNQMSFIEC